MSCLLFFFHSSHRLFSFSGLEKSRILCHADERNQNLHFPQQQPCALWHVFSFPSPGGGGSTVCRKEVFPSDLCTGCLWGAASRSAGGYRSRSAKGSSVISFLLRFAADWILNCNFTKACGNNILFYDLKADWALLVVIVVILATFTECIVTRNDNAHKLFSASLARVRFRALRQPLRYDNHYGCRAARA